MPRPAAGPSSRAAAAVDAVALVAFVIIGVSQHHARFLPGLLRTGIPLLVAWFLIGLLVGTYRRVGWITMVATWVVATPLALLARSVVRGGPWGRELLEFGAIAMGFTLLFLIGGRVLLLGVALLRRPRPSPDAHQPVG